MSYPPGYTDLVERGERAALSIARAQRLEIEKTELIYFGCNVTIRLHPHNIVARFSGRAAKFSSHVAARTREMEVSRYLADADAPVVSPSNIIDAGPYEEEGLMISFWKFFVEGDIDQRKIAALADYPGELPFLHGYADARRLFMQYWREGELTEEEFRETLGRISEMDIALAIMKEEMNAPPVPLHGDSHLRNTLCVGTLENPKILWIDWEDVCCGPVEWDYACLLVNLYDFPDRNEHHIANMKAAIADHTDPDRLELLIKARELQIDIWDGIP
ncbi:MAG: phosphotransferase [Alphaproteobacteria bacterium]|nr:phosphotransferase [Alphaproteobacteria bacterium]